MVVAVTSGFCLGRENKAQAKLTQVCNVMPLKCTFELEIVDVLNEVK